MIRRFKKFIGFEYELNKISMIIQLISMSKENAHLTEKEYKLFIKATSNYLDTISEKQQKLNELFGEFLYEDFKQETENLTFYKFISKETYEKYVSKGKFRLGSLRLYREIEKQDSKDEREGFCNLIITSGNRQIFTSLISGFNHYIFCGTDTLDESQLMTGKFGNVVLKIKNLRTFANQVQKAIGAKSWYFRKMKYTDYKAYHVNQIINDLNGVSPDLSEELFKHLLNYSSLPSIYSKPTLFKPENELRLSFEMDRNVKKELDFSDLGLLEDIEIIQ